jgi:hypothetical protein
VAADDVQNVLRVNLERERSRMCWRQARPPRWKHISLLCAEHFSEQGGVPSSIAANDRGRPATGAAVEKEEDAITGSHFHPLSHLHPHAPKKRRSLAKRCGGICKTGKGQGVAPHRRPLPTERARDESASEGAGGLAWPPHSHKLQGQHSR